MYKTLDSKILPMAAVVKEKNNEYRGIADSRSKLKDYQRYAKDFNEAAASYFGSQEGQEYLRAQNLSIDNLAGIGSVEMPEGIVAALIKHINGNNYMVSNGNFAEKICKMADKYNVSYDIAERFVLDHEATHIKCNDEVGTAEKQKNFYLKKAGEARKEGNELEVFKYDTLKDMAEDYIEAQEHQEAA